MTDWSEYRSYVCIDCLDNCINRRDSVPARNTLCWSCVRLDYRRQLYEAGLKYVRSVRESNKKTETNSDSDINEQKNSTGDQAGRFDKETKVPDDADATLITPDAQIDIRSRATYVAARALFEDVGRKYQSDSSPDSDENEEDITEYI